MTAAGARAALVAALLLAPAGASAHMRTATFSTVTAGGGRSIDWTVRVRARDLTGPDVGLGLPADAGVAQVLAHRAYVAVYLAGRLRVEERGARCLPAGTVPIELDPRAVEPTLAAHLTFACDRAPEAITLAYDLLFDADAQHTGYASVVRPGEAPVTVVFRARERRVSVDVAASAWRSAAAYLRLGVEHIFTGYDHLAFLAGLLIATGLRRDARAAGGGAGGHAQLRPATRRQALVEVLKLVTAFSVAHSITLIASTLRPGLLPTAWVEPAIALSIAYVGVENVLRPAPRHRWLLVFGFGLVHGLGFSSVLREIGLPARGLLLSLLAFNLGVELGQLATVAVVLPLVLVMASRRPAAFQRWVVLGGSAALALAGLIWFVARVSGAGA